MENILLIGKDPRLGYLKMLLDADGFPTNHISESPTDAGTAAPRVKEEDISLRRAAAHAGSIIGPTPFSAWGRLWSQPVFSLSCVRDRNCSGAVFPNKCKVRQRLPELWCMILCRWKRSPSRIP